jgi:hypothetical protein
MRRKNSPTSVVDRQSSSVRLKRSSKLITTHQNAAMVLADDGNSGIERSFRVVSILGEALEGKTCFMHIEDLFEVI